MRSAIVLAVASLALAGCFSPDAAEDESVGAASVDADGGSGPASSASGTPSSAAASQTSANPNAPAGSNGTAAPIVEHAVSIQGQTGYSACLPSGPSSCQGAPVPSSSENTFVELGPGTPVSAELTLTWEATTPATEEMVLSLIATRSCGDGCIEWDQEMFSAMVVGVSPLVLSAPSITLAANETLYLHVTANEPNPTAGTPVLMFYSVEQPFSIEGVLRAYA